jgi:protein ImuA
MSADQRWVGADLPAPSPPSASPLTTDAPERPPVLTSVPLADQWARGRRTHARQAPLPPEVAAALWHADELGSPVSCVLPSGFDALDAELPGGGWPGQSVTEVLQAQPGIAEWRLLGPAMAKVVADGGQVVVVGPTRTPHLPGLRQAGIDERQLVWVQAETPAERLWTTEQLVKSHACGLLVAWLPQARAEQIRRLQVCAQGGTGPVFLCRPLQARHEASAAPLRVSLAVGLDWTIELQILKRKGPVLDQLLQLRSVPGGLTPLLTPRLRRPSELIAARRHRDDDVLVGRAAANGVRQQHTAAH